MKAPNKRIFFYKGMNLIFIRSWCFAKPLLPNIQGTSLLNFISKIYRFITFKVLTVRLHLFTAIGRGFRRVDSGSRVRHPINQSGGCAETVIRQSHPQETDIPCFDLR